MCAAASPLLYGYVFEPAEVAPGYLKFLYRCAAAREPSAPPPPPPPPHPTARPALAQARGQAAVHPAEARGVPPVRALRARRGAVGRASPRSARSGAAQVQRPGERGVAGGDARLPRAAQPQPLQPAGVRRGAPLDGVLTCRPACQRQRAP
eukprot:scaffold2449_cov340-Prasinococcus_capsulatus_cf.AAC.12